MVDSHCHIAGPEFVDDLEAVVARARHAGLARAFIILAADDAPELTRADVVSGLWPEVRFAVGVHPHAAGRFAQAPRESAAAVRKAIAAQPRTRAVGEIGLDYHYDLSPRDVQRDVFSAQLALAQDLGRPVVIHTREADDDTVAILAESGMPTGVFHCFTGDVAMARRALDLGFYLSLSGIVTFPRATQVHEVATFLPLDRLLIETDSPFLAPVPHRGQRNEPAQVVRVCQMVAELRGCAPEVVASATAANFDRLFSP